MAQTKNKGSCKNDPDKGIKIHLHHPQCHNFVFTCDWGRGELKKLLS